MLMSHQNKPPGRVGEAVKHREADTQQGWLGDGPCEGWRTGLKDCTIYGVSATAQATLAGEALPRETKALAAGRGEPAL